jgi:uncharacterized protein (TIGR03437 family)
MFCQVSKCRLLWLVAALFLAGTSNGLFGQMLYVGNAGDDTISAYVIDQESGFLTEVLPRVATTGSPSSVAIHPGGKFVYVTNGGNPALGVNGPSLAAFSIDANTGALTLLSSSPLTPGTGPQGAVIDPSGKFLLVANGGANANNVAVFAIDTSTGALSPAPGSPFAAPQGPNKVVVHPNGKFAFVSAAGAGQIAVFNIGADGALTPAAGSPFAARNNLFWMTMDAAGKFLFAVERQDNAVLVYSVDATTGALTQVGSPFPAGPGVSGVAVDPAGQFLYVSNIGSGSVTVFSIGATGALTRRSDVGAVFGAFAAILDPSGKFLYVPGQGANAVVGFAIDSSSGALTNLGQFFPAGVQPQRGATVLLSPPIIPPISADSAFNAFSVALPGMPNAGIAQGSRLSISGKNIGPAAAVSNPNSLSDFPLGFELGGASIQIQSGGVTTAAIMIFASNGLVRGIVPSTTPLGDATVTVTYKGRTTTPLPITVVTTSVGIATNNGAGSGPAAQAVNNPDPANIATGSPNQTLNALNQSVKPGQTMAVRATGLGPVTFDETQGLSQELDIPVDVIVGNKLATAITKVRVNGTDRILFKLPDDAPEGCYVPIAIRAGGVTSNVASISISATGASCSDATGLAASDIDAAQKSGQISVGTIMLGHFDLGQLGVDNSANGIFARYDFNSLLRALSTGNDGNAIRSQFVTPPLGTCTVSTGAPTKPNDPLNPPPDPTFPQFLNVGQALNLSGPRGTVQLPAPSYSLPDGNVIAPGDYTVDNGTGSTAFGPFKAALNLPPMLTWTNKDALAFADRTQDLIVTWSGGIPDKEFALIVGIASSNQVTAGFLCAEKVSAGQFTIPAWVLSSLPRSTTFDIGGGQSVPGGALGVGTAPLSSVGRFTAPGLDYAVFTYEQATVSFVPYQ